MGEVEARVAKAAVGAVGVAGIETCREARHGGDTSLKCETRGNSHVPECHVIRDIFRKRFSAVFLARLNQPEQVGGE